MAILIVILAGLGLFLVSWFASVLHDINEIRDCIRRIDEDLRELKRHLIRTDPLEGPNVKRVDGPVRDVSHTVRK